MVKSKRIIILIGLALVLIVSSIAAISGVTRYYKINVGETKEFNAGRSGVTFIKAYYTGKVKLTRISKNAAPGDPSFNITQKPIDVRFRNSKGEWQYEVNNPVYVFFKLRGAEMDKWNAGKLSIYYYFRGDWNKCPTYEVWGRSSGEMRVSCRMKHYGLYSVGTK